MDKTIYKIRGNVFFKLGIYILIAVLAYASLFMGGLVLQGTYLGVFTDKNVGDTAYDRLVTSYSKTVNHEMTQSVQEYVNSLRFDTGEISGSIYDIDKNSDGVIDAVDVINSFDLRKALVAMKKMPSYENMMARADIGYKATITCQYSSGDDTVNPITITAGNSTLINDNLMYSGDDEFYDYGTTVDVPVYKYLLFSTEGEFDQVKNSVNELISGDGEYSEDVYWDESDEAETTTEETVADRIETQYPDALYNGNFPTSCYDVYLDDADGVNYCLILGYDSSYSYIDINARSYPDFDKAVSYIKDENPEIVANLGKWADTSEGIMVAFVAVVLLCIIMTIISMINAGVKTGLEKIKLERIERMPTELIVALLIGSVAAAVGILAAGGFYSKCLEQASQSCSFVTGNITYFALVLPVAILYVIAVLFLNNLVAKLKVGVVFADCLIIRGLKWIWRKIRSAFRYVRDNLSLTAKGVGVYVAITIVEIIALILIVAASYDGAIYVFLYIIFKWLCIVGIVAFLIQTQELYKCAKDMADGNLDRKADTRKMFWVFRAHGEHLNQISDGMVKAVDARMKSEHLKTELITNVSHDIKTPLTSIINYVDLLQRDDLDEKSRQEYIDVLSRQSARLKKLIEDLVEASKASTGNIQINWADIDANMLLEQAVAEYEDKLANAGLKVIFTRSETPAVIKADGQHLWRVFDNLLANISKYAMPGTRVYASVVHDAGSVRIEFKNISREALNVSSDELMERFVRGDSSRNTEGSGLGLSIANSLCTLMGAKFSLSIDGDLFKAVIEFNDKNKKVNA